MKNFIKYLIIISLLVYSCAIPNLNLKEAPDRYVGYVPVNNLDYEANSYLLKTATHLNIFFFNADENGKITYWNQSESQDTILKEFTAKAQSNGQKVLLSLGGGIDENSPLISIYEKVLSDSNRTAFIKNLIDYTEQVGADGLDIDLEYKCINKYYNIFIQELSAELHKRDKILTCAIAKYQGVLLTQKTFAAYDFLSIMIYDYTGLGSDEPGDLGSFEHMEKEMDYWTGVRKIDAKKIVIGVPFYGYWWEKNPKGVTVDKGAISYNKLVSLFPEEIRTKDNFTVTKENGNTVTYCTNSIATIKAKAEFSRNYGGIMCWHLLNDSKDDSFNLSGMIISSFN
ncbi:MAG: hypothetical protein JXR63_09340 [Spirochaetales bacterium]|nr:hypothetical protein [Spirochaetales bacterium]